MPIARIQLPDGRIARIEVPEGTTPQQAEAFARQAAAKQAPQRRVIAGGSIEGQSGRIGVPAPKRQAKPKDDSRVNALLLGAMKPVDNLATWLANTPPGQLLDKAGQAMGMQSTAQATAQNQSARQNNTRTGYQLVGNIAGTLPTAYLPGGILAQGAASGALLSEDPNDPMGVARDMAIGAAAGKVGEKVTRGAARVISPKVAPVVKRLQARGIPLTPGQIMGAKETFAGRAVKGIEDKATSIPGVGDAIVSARRRGVEAFNRAAIDEVLSPIGGRLPKAIETGNASVGYAEKALGKAYGQILPQISAQADEPFAKAMVETGKLADVMVPERAVQFEKIVTQEMDNAFQGGSTLTGEGFKKLEYRLGAKVRQFISSPDPDQRELGAALREVQSHVRDLAARQNPQQAARLARINEGWAKLTRVQRAAAQGLEGQFTPGQLRTATRVADTSVRKGASARGDALMQGFAADAQKVLPSSIPDSGTAGRGMMGLALGGVGGIPAMAASGAAALPYTQAGGKAAEWLLTGRQGPVSQAIANAMRKLVPLTAGASAAASNQLPAQ